MSDKPTHDRDDLRLLTWSDNMPESQRASIEKAYALVKSGSPVMDAVSNKRGADQQRIATEGLAWIDLLLRKNADYGCAVWKSPTLKPSMDCADAILVRMSDKIERIRSLLSGKEQAVADESLADTIRDLGAYCLLYLARPRLGPDGCKQAMEQP